MTLRVKLEIVPHGDENKSYEIGRLDIFNEGIAPPSSDGWDLGGYYQYGVINITPQDVGLYNEKVLHRRHEGAWELVRATLNSLPINGPFKR